MDTLTSTNSAASPGKRSLFVTADGQNLFFTFALVSSLFLLWGFCNGMIDVMDKHFQNEFHFTKAQSAWVQTAHYLGYLLMSLPAGWFARKLGYKGGIIGGLMLVSVGGFWFVPATGLGAFWAFLLGVCIIAAGLAFLETVANPYTTVLGHPQYAAARINLAQTCNGLGWILGPIVGSMYFYSKDAAGASTGDQTLYIPYLGIALVVLVLAGIFFVSYLPDIKAEDDYQLDEATDTASHSLLSRPHFVMAVAAQFLYVAAQAGIFSFFINYMTSETPVIPESWNAAMASLSASLPHFRQDWLTGWFETSKAGLLGFSDKGAANLASLAFVFFLVGRVIGAMLLKKASAHKVLGTYGLLNVLLCGVIFLKVGWVSVVSVFLSYFFMSIMFPTIFALGIFGLGLQSKKASAFIVMGISGGMFLPKVMGAIADRFDMSRGFAVPMLCFCFVAFYGFAWPRLSKSKACPVPSCAGH